MTTYTTEQKQLINTYENLKTKLLKEYKGYATQLTYAEDTFEEDIYIEKREKLAIQIKDLSRKLKEIKTIVS